MFKLLSRSQLSLQSIKCNCQTSNRFISSSTSTFSTSNSTTPIPSTSTSNLPTESIYTLPKGLVLSGFVIKTGKMSQTSTVTVERRVTDHKTLKEFKKNTNYLIHDPDSICVVGDQVSIRNCKPVSKRKRFELVSVIRGVKTVGV